MKIFVNERNITMNNRNNTNKCILPICGLCFLSYVLLTSNIEGSVTTIDHAAILRSKGYPADTTEQIIKATQNESYFIRHVALTLLTERKGKQAIPELKEALNDPRMEVRWRAAHLLGTLGDRSGVERMRQDLREFAPNNGAPAPADPNIQDKNKVTEPERKRNLRLYYGLHAAKVLAEFGDRRGYKLAVRMALTGKLAAQRSEAIRVLVEIAKTDKEILVKEKIDPVSDLCAIAQFEKVPSVFGKLTSYVEELSENDAVLILESATKSTYQPKEIQEVTKYRLAKAKKRAEATRISFKETKEQTTNANENEDVKNKK